MGRSSGVIAPVTRVIQCGPVSQVRTRHHFRAMIGENCLDRSGVIQGTRPSYDLPESLDSSGVAGERWLTRTWEKQFPRMPFGDHQTGLLVRRAVVDRNN